MGAEKRKSDPTVFVVDNDRAVLKSICALLGSFGQRTEPFESAIEFLESYQVDRPGCLVTDVRMFGMTGLELQERLLQDGVTLPIIFISAHAETTLTVRAMKNGAITFLEKPFRDVELWDAIRTALAVDAKNQVKMRRRRHIQTCLSRLTPPERQVLDLIVEGQLNKQIATNLGVSIRTVESRRHNIFKKLETESVAELVKLVVEEQYV